MSDYYTIYSVNPDYISVISCVERISTKSVEIFGKRDEWNKLIVSDQNSSVTFNPLKRRISGDKVSKLVLVTYNYIRNIEASATEDKDEILKTITNCNFIVGIVVSPGFNEYKAGRDLVLSVTQTLDGLLFNGSSMIDGYGRKILDSNGEFDARLHQE